MSSRFRPVLTMMFLTPLVLFGPVSLAQASPPGQQAQAVSAPTGGGQDGSLIVQREVSFQVQNVNRSRIPCEADGKTYTVRGHITGPEWELDSPQAVTLFLHGLSYGEFFTNYTAQPGYNFAEKQAAAGNVTVTIDRLGYDSSDKPVGTDICFGSRADIAHQMVLALRSGDYQTAGEEQSAAFGKVVLAGHSVGGIIAQAEAYSFGDIDGLMVLSYSDTTVSPAAMAALQTATTQCQAGGELSDGDTGAPGYVYFGAATPEQFIMAHFFTENAEPVVVDTTASLRNRDPCGDITSYMTAVDTNLANIAQIQVPVLVLIGGKDAIYPIAAEQQAALLTGTTDRTAVNIPDTGHALTLHLSRNQFSSEVSTWLGTHGFGPSQMLDMPVGAPDTGVELAPEAAVVEQADHPALALIGLGGGVFLAGALAAGAIAVSRRRTPAKRAE